MPSTVTAQTGLNAIAQASSGGSASSSAMTTDPTPSSLYGVPEYQLLNPMNGMNSAWQITNPAASLYVGGSTPTTPYSENAIVAALADKMGIRAKKGQSLEEQVLATLGKRYDVAPTWKAVSDKLHATTDATTLQQVPGTASSRPDYLRSAAAKLGVKTVGQSGADQTVLTANAAEQVRNLSFDQIKTLQQQLYDGGWYSDAIYNDPSTNFTPGQLDNVTMMAFGHLLNASAAAYAKGDKVTWQDVLNATANQGSNPTVLNELTKQGIYVGGPVANAAAAKKAKITEATSAETQAPLQSAFQSQLGYLPSNADLSKFTSAYDAAQAAHAGQAATQGMGIDFGTGSVPGSGVPVVPGVPSVSAAAIPFAQAENPVGYVGHQVSNAYALLLNALGMGRTATSTLPGYNPNITKANTGI